MASFRVVPAARAAVLLGASPHAKRLNSSRLPEGGLPATCSVVSFDAVHLGLSCELYRVPPAGNTICPNKA